MSRSNPQTSPQVRQMKEHTNTNNPIDLLFGGMEKLAPGGNIQRYFALAIQT